MMIINGGIKVEDSPALFCCQQEMTITRTKTRRTHTCKKCGGFHYFDAERSEIFGMNIIVSEQITSEQKNIIEKIENKDEK